MKLNMLATGLFILCASFAQAQDYHLLDFDLVAPVVPNATGIPNQTGLLFYQIGVGFRGVNAAGGFDTLSPVGNGVTSSGAAERIERALITQTGATTCTISSQSGSWLSSVTCGSTGAITMNVATGIFSAAPTCTLTAFDNGAPGYFPILTSLTATTVAYRTANNSGTAANIITHVICMGPR